MPIGISVSRWRRRSLKDYVANRRKATLLGKNLRTGLRNNGMKPSGEIRETHGYLTTLAQRKSSLLANTHAL